MAEYRITDGEYTDAGECDFFAGFVITEADDGSGVDIGLRSVGGRQHFGNG